MQAIQAGSTLLVVGGCLVAVLTLDHLYGAVALSLMVGMAAA